MANWILEMNRDAFTNDSSEHQNSFRACPTRAGMEILATPCAGNLPARARPQLRAPFTILRRTITKAQRQRHDYFKKPSDWLRVVMLGVILLQLAIIAFASNLFGRVEIDYVLGTGNMVAGVFSLFILVKIARPKSYTDWLIEAFLQLTIGAIVASDHMLDTVLSFSTAIVAFMLLFMVRLWIAVTMFHRLGYASLAAGAVTTIFLLCWLIASKLTSIILVADTILATDLAIRAISIIMFGLALRK
ncbi:hypothetical protein CFBP5507_25685 (plasmid) [Agrobacterium salinitolerans]|uniref:Uncharacterized protein n=1 Tax=Agrobacterium salinitolerans TaxID=1183413 RepID=A0A4Z1R0Q8_9HYPH|nr:hypothetical protein [Agrobacterium salinitolerans]UYZ10914.1 hypothetical protein CFBP5507_25685 [Agrobacterium salinitolerans]